MISAFSLSIGIIHYDIYLLCMQTIIPQNSASSAEKKIFICYVILHGDMPLILQLATVCTCTTPCLLLPFSQKETTFVISCLLCWMMVPFQSGVNSKREGFAPRRANSSL